MSIKALETYLIPLEKLFAMPNVAEISINKPGEAWIEVKGEMFRHELPEFDLNHLKSLGRLVAQSTEQMISEERPILSATLPQGYRIQVIFPPACEAGNVVMSIRKQTILDMDLNDYEAIGAFQSTVSVEQEDSLNKTLSSLLDKGEIKNFLSTANCKNSVILLFFFILCINKSIS